MTDAHPSDAGQATSGSGRSAASSNAETDSTSDGSDSFWRKHRRTIGAVLAVLVAVGFFYYFLPRVVGLKDTLRLLRRGRVGWLAFGVVLEACSLFGEAVLFRGVFRRPGNRIDWRASTEITLAGAAATKIFAAAGAGGIALTVWALRGYGLSASEVSDGLVCYEIVLYSVYAAAVAIAGFGLWLGLFSGRAPVGLTLIPAVVAVVVILIVLSMLVVYEPLERSLQRRAERSSGRAAKRWRRAATVPRTIHAGLVAAIDMVKRRDPALLGGLAYWGFDIGTLWASFHAFGHSPTGAVLVMGYYLGTLGNALPMPGGVGGVEGGMIAAFLGFGVKGSLATLAVLGYRTISYWLPTIPGAIAYFRLRKDIGSEPSTESQAETEA